MMKTDNTRRCRGCHRRFPADSEHFAHYLSRAGERRLRHACKECWRMYEAVRKTEYRARKRAERAGLNG